MKTEQEKQWIGDSRRPAIIEDIDNWGKSKKVVVLIEGGNPEIAEYNKGVEDGKEWDQWYSPSVDDVVENVIAWCDCIPNH